MTPFRRSAIALLLVALATAACGSDEPTAAPPPPDPIVDLPKGIPDVDQPPAPPGDGIEQRTDTDGQAANLVVAHGATEDPRPHAFERVEIGPDGVTATVFFWSGVEPCSVLDRVDVAYDEAEIVVTLFVGSTAGPEASCIALAEYKAVDVTLDEPLAGRPVVDGAR